MFSLRILTINYYLTKPEKDLDCLYSDFRCLEVKQVPVILNKKLFIVNFIEKQLF